MLTPREREVVTFMARGLTAREIGARLLISERTVERHMEAVREKLDARNKTHAVVIALREGQISLETV